MKGKIWAKTILQAYNYVNRIIRSIDKMVVERSAASHHSFGYADTLRVAEEIMALIERKRHLICMKHLVEDSLQFMEPGSSKLLMLRFIDKQSVDSIAELTSSSVRSVHRNMDKALAHCAAGFVRQGYPVAELEEFFKDECWLVGMFNANIDKIKNGAERLSVPEKLPAKKSVISSYLYNIS